MLRKVLVVVCLSVALLTLVMSISCGEAKPEEGQLPTWKVGDYWRYVGQSEGPFASYVYYEVTGEDNLNGIDCWLVKQSSSDTLPGEWNIWYDKATLLPLKTEGADSPPTFSSVCSYQPSNVSYFPLEVGKETTITSACTMISGQPQKTQNTTATIRYKVEAMEEITVPAGTFNCFRITEDNSTTTRWHSDEVRWNAKWVNQGGMTYELKSYSV